MRQLTHGAPPVNFANWVAERPDATWDEVRDADHGALYKELRDCLAKQQNWLCAFCEINLIPSDFEIEHWHPKFDQNRPPNWAIHFENFQAGCKGGTSNQHPWADEANRFCERDPINISCGAKKGEIYPEELGLYHTRDIPHKPPIYFVDFEGEIHVHQGNCALAGIDSHRAAVTLETLGLNCPRLRRARAQWWQKVSGDMISLMVDFTPDEIARRYLTPDDNRELPRFFTTLRSMFGAGAERILI